MIHKLLNLTRNLFVLDVESTGTNVQTDRIIELGFQQFNADGLVKEYTTRINPGIPIPPSSTKIHHITDADVAGKPTFKQLAESFARGFKDCDFAGKRVTFDLQILASEVQRAGVSWSIDDARLIDADRLEALLNPRSLSHLYKKYTGEDLKDAHGALTDVKATTVVLEAQMAQMIFDKTEGLPRDVATLHALSFPGFIDLGQKFRFVNGIPCFSQWGKYANRPMKDADVGYWDFIIRSDFGADVKALAGNAKLGKFPVQEKGVQR